MIVTVRVASTAPRPRFADSRGATRPSYSLGDGRTTPPGPRRIFTMPGFLADLSFLFAQNAPAAKSDGSLMARLAARGDHRQPNAGPPTARSSARNWPPEGSSDVAGTVGR